MTNRGSAWTGWVFFAGAVLALLGAFNIVYGIFALIENDVLTLHQGRLIVVDLTGWGIAMVVFGVLQILVGTGLLLGNAAARVAAIILVALHALLSLASLDAYPVWSIMMIALDVVVMYALTVHWREAREEIRDEAGVYASAGRMPRHDARVG